MVLYDFADPSLRRFDGSHLNACKGIIQLLGNRSHGVHAAWEADFPSVVHNPAHRRDNGCCSAQSALCELIQFRKLHRPLGYLKAQIMLCHVHKGAPGNGWRMESDLGVTTSPSFVTNRKLAPPVSSIYVLVPGPGTRSRHILLHGP